MSEKKFEVEQRWVTRGRGVVTVLAVFDKPACDSEAILCEIKTSIGESSYVGLYANGSYLGDEENRHNLVRLYRPIETFEATVFISPFGKEVRIIRSNKAEVIESERIIGTVTITDDMIKRSDCNE